MNLIDILKQNPLKTWKWVAIVLFCLLFLQTCSKCSTNQTLAFSEKGYQEQVDSLKNTNKQLQDSILVLRGDMQTCDKSNKDLQKENEYLRDALKQSQAKPVIIYKDNK